MSYEQVDDDDDDQLILWISPDNSETRDTRHETRDPRPPFQDLTSGCKQPESDNKHLQSSFNIV